MIQTDCTSICSLIGRRMAQRERRISHPGPVTFPQSVACPVVARCRPRESGALTGRQTAALAPATSCSGPCSFRLLGLLKSLVEVRQELRLVLAHGNSLISDRERLSYGLDGKTLPVSYTHLRAHE